VGVGALLAASATALTVLKWIGAAYLLWVGIRMLASRAPAALSRDADLPATRSMKEIFVQGFGTNALNPKVALFFLAFLPQFISPTMEHETLAFVLLGLLFDFNGLWVNIGWALVASWLASRVAAVRRGMHGLERIAGAMFIGFGLKLALSDNPAQ
jgi:threonine/homoserine/homoserine lactone efflux protein